MKHYELTIITILLLAFSFNGMAQNREAKREITPTALKAEPVKIEHINNQDILRIASQSDTIRIPLSDDIWTQIENLMQANVGASIVLKDIEGAEVNLLRVSKNMKPGIYFRNKMTKSISVLNQELELIRKTSKAL
jgi:hypothetical protein